MRDFNSLITLSLILSLAFAPVISLAQGGPGGPGTAVGQAIVDAIDAHQPGNASKPVSGVRARINAHRSAEDPEGYEGVSSANKALKSWIDGVPEWANSQISAQSRIEELKRIIEESQSESSAFEDIPKIDPNAPQAERLLQLANKDFLEAEQIKEQIKMFKILLGEAVDRDGYWTLNLAKSGGAAGVLALLRHMLKKRSAKKATRASMENAAKYGQQRAQLQAAAAAGKTGATAKAAAEKAVQKIAKPKRVNPKKHWITGILLVAAVTYAGYSGKEVVLTKWEKSLLENEIAHLEHDLKMKMEVITAVRGKMAPEAPRATSQLVPFESK